MPAQCTDVTPRLACLRLAAGRGGGPRPQQVGLRGDWLSSAFYSPSKPYKPPVPVPDPPIEPEEPPKPPDSPFDSALDDFWYAYIQNRELPVITPAQFRRLKIEINTGHYTPHDLVELEFGRFKGRGFGVDYSKE